MNNENKEQDNIKNPFLDIKLVSNNENNISNNEPINYNQQNDIPNNLFNNNQIEQNAPINNPMEFQPLEQNNPLNNNQISNNSKFITNEIMNNQDISQNNNPVQLEEKPNEPINNISLEQKQTMDMLLKNDTIKNDNQINAEKKKENTNNNIGLILLGVDLVCLILLFIGSIYGLIGAITALVCFIVSIIYFKKKIQYIKIASCASLIIVVAYISLILFASKSVNGYLFESKKNAYKDTASSYIDTALKYVNKNNLINCNDSKSVSIPLKKLINESDYIDDTSPFGNKIDLLLSYIKVEAEDDECKKLDYYIYITDGEYSIGEPNNPMAKEDVWNKEYDIN